MIPPPLRRLRPSIIIIISIMLTVLLISSPVMTLFSASSSLSHLMVLEVGFAFASSSGNEDDDEESNTDDATTTDDGQEEGGDGGDEQQEDDSEQQQQDVQGDTEEEQQDGGGEEEQQQQFATVVGEICDDFEDNDGDGLIDLADVEDCAAPLTQGTITAPTTTPPPPSVVNTTATNSTNNTLTAAGITESPYIVEVCGNRIDDDGDGLADLDDFEGCATPSTSSNTRYMTPSGDIVDVTGCTSFEELGLPPPPPRAGLNEPPGLVYFDCDNITFGLIPLDSSTTTDSGTVGQGEGLVQGQQQPPPQQQQQGPGTTATTTTTGTLQSSVPPDWSLIEWTLWPEGGRANLNGCTPFFELLGRVPPPPPPGAPPNLVWFECGGVMISAVPLDSSTTTDSGTVGQGEGLVQGQQPQQQQQGPGTTSIDSNGVRTATFPGGNSIATNPNDGSVTYKVPKDNIEIISSPRDGLSLVHKPDPSRGLDGFGLNKSPNGDVSVTGGSPNSPGFIIQADGTAVAMPPSSEDTIALNPDRTLTIDKPTTDPITGATIRGGGIQTTYSLDGTAATKNPDGTTDIRKTGVVNSNGVVSFPGGIAITEITPAEGGTTVIYVVAKENDYDIRIISSPRDGLSLVHKPDPSRGLDGFGLNKSPNGDVSVTGGSPNSPGFIIQADGTAVAMPPSSEDTIALDPAGTLVVSSPGSGPGTAAGGTEQQTTITGYAPDGSIAIRNPDGTSRIDLPANPSNTQNIIDFQRDN